MFIIISIPTPKTRLLSRAILALAFGVSENINGTKINRRPQKTTACLSVVVGGGDRRGLVGLSASPSLANATGGDFRTGGA